MDLSIIIVNWNSGRLLGDCLQSLQDRLGALNYEVIVVDNRSDPADVRYLQEELKPRFSWARFVFSNENLGFAKANNEAVKMAAGKYVLLLNPDTCFVQAGFTRLFDLFSQPNVGMVHCKLLNGDGTLQKSLYYFPSLSQVAVSSLLLHKLLPRGLRCGFQFSEQDHQSSQSPDWVFGAFMLLPRAVMEELGGFDESMFMYGEDMDLCFRIKQAGYEILYLPEFEIVHYGGQSGRQAWSDAKKETLVYRALFHFYRKHYGRGHLLLAKVLFALGALLRLGGYAAISLLPGSRGRGLHEMKTQWWVLLTQLNLK